MKKKNDEPKVFYYDDVTQDFMETKKQNYVLPDDYEFIPNSKFFEFRASIVYFFAKIFANVYCRLFLHVTIKNREVIKKAKGSGYFIYGNHSNPLSDVFTPGLVSDRRIYTVCSPANFGIPVIGHIIPEIGGLPLGKNLEQKKAFRAALDQRIKEKKCVVIYPEAHLWPYYTGIRDFPNKSFKYPVDLNVPVFAITTTYQKRKYFKKPKITVYVDGPFYPDKKLDVEQNREKLKMDVYNAMKERSKNTNYEYYRYIPKSSLKKEEK